MRIKCNKNAGKERRKILFVFSFIMEEGGVKCVRLLFLHVCGFT